MAWTWFGLLVALIVLHVAVVVAAGAKRDSVSPLTRDFWL